MGHHMQTVFSLTLILFTILTIGYQITPNIKTSIESNNNKQDLLMREKRQLENFDADDTITSEQEEPGFWDKVVKVALRLFNKLIEWLNSA